MPSICFSQVRGIAMRVTRVDECCAVDETTAPNCTQVVSDGFVTATLSDEILEGTDIELLNAAGKLCVSDQSCPELKWVNVEIEFCRVDPELFNLLTGQPMVLDHAGNAVGFRKGTAVNCDTGFSLEVWSDVPGIACDVTTGAPVKQWGYTLVPCVVNGFLTGDLVFQNDAATFTITGRSRVPSVWGQGPFNVVAQDALGTAGPLLTAIDATEHEHMQLTTIAPPQPSCGCTALDPGPVGP